MSEREWLEGTKTWFMLPHIPQPASERKLRLFACACVRRVWHVWHLLPDERSRGAVEVAERFADGLADEGELEAAHAAAPFLDPPPPDAEDATAAEIAASARSSALALATVAASHAATQRRPLSFPFRREFLIGAANEVATCAAHARGWAAAGAVTGADGSPQVGAIAEAQDEAYWEEVRCQCGLLRCIFGNPFRPIAFDPAWCMPKVTALASAAYEERSLPAGILDTQRLAVLADAMEDAGCADTEMLSHLRGPGPHVRGCWVLDLLLGKE